MQRSQIAKMIDSPAEICGLRSRLAYRDLDPFDLDTARRMSVYQ